MGCLGIFSFFFAFSSAMKNPLKSVSGQHAQDFVAIWYGPY
jgi:hypothetical protein